MLLSNENDLHSDHQIALEDDRIMCTALLTTMNSSKNRE